MTSEKNIAVLETRLLTELSALIERGKQEAVAQVNSTMTLVFWEIGNRINLEILDDQRATYGKGIVATVSRQLTELYGRSFEEKNLRRMMQFAEQFGNHKKVVTLSRQLSWSHFLALLPLKKWEAKEFYGRTGMNTKMTNSPHIKDCRDTVATIDRGLLTNNN
tara:strand:- start:36 stop:524 length:489 start_codon:yes stop_codon:yes gene_type:complete